MTRGRTAQPGDKLTPTEIKVLRMTCDGDMQKVVASKLGLSLRTIEAHKISYRRKLGGYGKTNELVVIRAIQAGYITLNLG